MLQVAAAQKRGPALGTKYKPREVHRGAQRAPLKCITNELGKREYPPKTEMQISSAKKQRQINADKHQFVKLAAKAVAKDAKHAAELATANNKPLV
jgi:hypothetical protein